MASRCSWHQTITWTNANLLSVTSKYDRMELLWNMCKYIINPLTTENAWRYNQVLVSIVAADALVQYFSIQPSTKAVDPGTYHHGTLNIIHEICIKTVLKLIW